MEGLPAGQTNVRNSSLVNPRHSACAPPNMRLRYLRVPTHISPSAVRFPLYTGIVSPFRSASSRRKAFAANATGSWAIAAKQVGQILMNPSNPSSPAPFLPQLCRRILFGVMPERGGECQHRLCPLRRVLSHNDMCSGSMATAVLVDTTCSSTQ